MTAPASTPESEPVADRLDAIIELLSQPDALAETSTLATVVSAAATGILAIFAVAAWIASMRSLKLMREQERTTAEAAAAQVADQTWGRQMDALARYLDRLLELHGSEGLAGSFAMATWRGDGYSTEAHYRLVEQRRRLIHQIESAGAIWRLQHRTDLEATFLLEAAEEEVLDAVETPKSSHKGAWRDALRLFIEMVQHWQVSHDKERDAASIHSMMHEAVRLKEGDESPRSGTQGPCRAARQAPGLPLP